MSRRSRIASVVVACVVVAAVALVLVGIGGKGSGSKSAATSPAPPSESARPSTTPASRPAATTPPPTPSPTRRATPTPKVKLPLRVELWGDSIAAQAAPNISFTLGLGAKVVSRLHTFGGSALCDWFTDMRNEINQADPAAFHPQAAVIQFSGDAFTPCMHDANGVAYGGQGLVNKYAVDSALVIALFAQQKIPVYFVSTPISAGQALQGYVGLTPIDAMFSKLPARFPAGHLVRYVDGASPLEWHGHYSVTLPCLPGETCTGRWPDGTKTVVVRQSDGAHFCPVDEVVNANGSKTCPVFMPGAQRFAAAIAVPIFRDFGL